MELTRRDFMKSVGAASLAVAAAGLLGGCEEADLVGNATGTGDTAELRDIKMRVKSVSYASYSDGTYYFVPQIRIYNGTAVGIPLEPTGGSFRIRLNGTAVGLQ